MQVESVDTGAALLTVAGTVGMIAVVDAAGVEAVVAQLAADGMAILMVEHDVPLVMRVCGRIVVLDFGQVIARGTPEEIQADEAVLDAYLGSATGEVG